jgi:phytanoyl-CoA hydroxylase
VRGSATNFSGKERRFLLFQYRAADAWPLLGFKDGIE